MAKLIVGQNDLATVNPNLAVEWHPSKNGSLLPSQITAGSNKKVWWLFEGEGTWMSLLLQYQGSCRVQRFGVKDAGLSQLVGLFKK